MTSLINMINDARAEVALRLPNSAFTRSGVAFRPNEDLWAWVDGPFQVHLDFTKVNFPASFPGDSLKHILVVFAKRSSACHLINMFQAFTHFLSLRNASTPLGIITAEDVSNYAARLKNHEKWRLSSLNVLLQKWGALGHSGVDPACTQYLRERRKPGNVKGIAVRTRDPIAGPFSEAEYTALYKAVDAAYGEGRVLLWVSVLTRLLFACGGRISQYASLKVKDFVARNGEFLLQLPQVKNREVHSRISLKEFSLSPQTGRLLQQHIEGLTSLNHFSESALFPEEVIMVNGPNVPRRHEADLFFGHCTSSSLSKAINAALKEIAPPTERLGFEPMPVAPRRFRYTFGTRLAEEGASKAVIADRLGHVDLQNVEVYFEASPKIVENIDRAMDAYLAPLAHAFRGHLVEDEEHSTHKGAPGSRILDFRVAKEPVGSCGAKGQGCSFNKPTACYTCFKFEPWLDAPHEKVLLRLRAERERCASDERLAAINDDAIRAVQEVIAECNQAREQRIGAAA
jgi:integrase